MPTTVPETPLAQSRLTGHSSHRSDPAPPLPNILFPCRGPVQARLRGRLLDRFFHGVDLDADAINTGDAAAEAESPLAHDEAADLAPTDEEGAPETDLRSSTTSLPRPAPQRTYGGSRSHITSQSQPQLDAVTTAGITNNDTAPSSRPNSPTLVPEDLLRKERARVLVEKLRAELQVYGLDRPRPRRLFAETTQAPTSQPQARPPSRTSGNAPEVRTGGTRRVDPVSAARNDMLRFNEARAKEQATSFVQAVTRQSEHTARRPPTLSRRLDELLPDDEESLAQAEAYSKKKWPPLARDISGIERQVLIMAKIHLFAYALVQGIYQTRATLLRWAAAVHEATWEMELPTTPYVRPDDEQFEIMVNNIATLRGKVKERARPFTATAGGFQQSMNNQGTIHENLKRFSTLYPNNFHCKTYCPRRGHFENSEIGHCIAALLFHGPNSVGMLYPDYFRDMPLTVVAFTLAMWQFCIEEWSNGWHVNGDLGAGAMREKYEATLSSLKELRDIAPRRMERLQREWREYVEQYSGATFKSPEELEAEGAARPSEMRPDTPEPEDNAMGVDEMNEQLFETARQASLRERMLGLISRHGVRADDAAMDLDDDGEPEEQPDDRTRSRSPTPPPVELDENGRLTARSKGKGRAN